MIYNNRRRQGEINPIKKGIKKMRYFLVFGIMFDKIVMASDESEVKGHIIKEMSKEEALEYANRIDRPENID